MPSLWQIYHRGTVARVRKTAVHVILANSVQPSPTSGRIEGENQYGMSASLVEADAVSSMWDADSHLIARMPIHQTTLQEV